MVGRPIAVGCVKSGIFDDRCTRSRGVGFSGPPTERTFEAYRA